MSMRIFGLQQAQDAIKKELSKLGGRKVATVGIHEDAGAVPDGAMSMATLGAIQHFGADIQHPGGTKYAIQSDGRAKFVKNGRKARYDGVTGPHVIKIPPRPWLDVGVASATAEYLSIIKEGIEAGLNEDQILEQIGVSAEGAVKQYIRDLKDPPNAPSTIKKKGSDNPLIDTGAMMQSVTYKIQRQMPEEGL